MGKISFTPYIKGGKLIVEIDGLEDLPNNQEMISKFFSSLTGISEECINKPDSKDEVIKSEVKKDYSYAKDFAFASNAEFKYVAKAYLRGIYDNDEKEKKIMKKLITDYLKEEVKKYNPDEMSNEELNEFFDCFSVGIGKKTMGIIEKKYETWEEFIENGYLGDKRMICERIKKTYR